MPSQQEIMEQLALLRELTRSTGILHEAQKLQLDYWVRVVVDDATGHYIEAKLEGAGRQVTYVVTTSNAKKKKTKKKLQALQKKLATLDEYVKVLLGRDVTVQVKIDGKLVGEFGPNDCSS